jgi:hypothetical protein
MAEHFWAKVQKRSDNECWPWQTRYQVAIDQLGMTQQQTAELLKCNERTSRRWALGELRTPHDVMLVLMLMGNFGIYPEDIEKIERRRSKKWFGDK